MAISDARHRANEKYNAKAYDEIKVRVSKGRKAELQAAAERHGQSVNGLINSLIDAWMEQAGAVAVPADGSEGTRAGEDTGTQGAGVMVFSAPVQNDDSSSRFTTQSPPNSPTGQPDDEPEFIKTIKRLAAMSSEERDKAMGVDPESVERYRQRMEHKRQRLAKLDAKVAKGGGLSRAEDAERRRLMVDLRHYDPTQE